MTTSTSYASFPKDLTCSDADDKAYEAGYQAGYNGTEYVRPFSNNDRTFYRNGHKQGMADKVYVDNSESAIDKIKSDLSLVGVTAIVKVKADFIHDIYTVYNGRSIVAKGQLADVQSKVSVYVSTEKSLQADYKNFKY